MSRTVNLRAAAIAICASLLAAGCATIVHGTKQVIPVTTNPPGATVQLDNDKPLTTPTQVKLERKRDYVMTISKAGYQTQTIPVNSVLSGWVAGNLVFGGLIGGGVDAISGGAFTLIPELINVTLVPLAPGQRDAGRAVSSLTTVQKLEILERLHKEGTVNDKEYAASKVKLNEDLKKEVIGEQK